MSSLYLSPIGVLDFALNLLNLFYSVCLFFLPIKQLMMVHFVIYRKQRGCLKRWRKWWSLRSACKRENLSEHSLGNSGQIMFSSSYSLPICFLRHIYLSTFWMDIRLNTCIMISNFVIFWSVPIIIRKRTWQMYPYLEMNLLRQFHWLRHLSFFFFLKQSSL